MKDRITALRELLQEGTLATQDDLRKKLEKLNYAVTQSTVSRDLRKIGAVRAVDSEGHTVYQLPGADFPERDLGRNIVRNIQANSSLAVIHTSPGSASLVARHLDLGHSTEFLGTIAGDDTVFVALSGTKSKEKTVAMLEEMLKGLS